LVVDTGPLVALGDHDDHDHHACRELLETDAEPLVTTGLVVAEAGYLLNRVLGPPADQALVAMILDGGIHVEALTITDWTRGHELIGTYDELNIGVTDATLIAIAERLGATRIATLDHRHFGVVRPAHIDAFELVPDIAWRRP
jgi:hypothetical protein